MFDFDDLEEKEEEKEETNQPKEQPQEARLLAWTLDRAIELRKEADTL